MAHVRGRDLLEALSFVRQQHGAVALERVLAELSPEARSAFAGLIREVDWYPLQALDEYLKAACRILDPGSLELCRNEGRFTAERQKAGLLHAMVGTSELRTRMAPTTWRMFYDVGRLEVIGDSPETAVGRILDFPATAELCARFLGIWEGMASTPERPAVAEETHCVRRGDAFCEIRLRDEARK
jgi:hypothetical protein